MKLLANQTFRLKIAEGQSYRRKVGAEAKQRVRNARSPAMQHALFSIAVGVVVAMGQSLPAADDEPNPLPRAQKSGALQDKDEELRAAVVSTAKKFAQRIELKAGPTETKLELSPEPILHWSNPTIGTVFGEVYVWTDKGRPAVVASWYRWFSPDWGATLEACSLTEKHVAGRVGDVRFWSPDKPGLSLNPLAEIDSPAKTPAARLGQMRRLASDFSAHLADTRGNAAGVKRELRMLKQPVYRYPTAEKDATYLDGALFAFVEGTDPELFLLLEAVKAKDGANWHFGLARMNGDEMQVDFRDKKVWSVPTIKDWNNMVKEPYALFKSEHVFLEPVAKEKKEAGR